MKHSRKSRKRKIFARANLRRRIQCNNEISMHFYRTRHEIQVKEATEQRWKPLGPRIFERARLVNICALPNEGPGILSHPRWLWILRCAPVTLKRVHFIGSTPSTDAGRSARELGHHHIKFIIIKRSSASNQSPEDPKGGPEKQSRPRSKHILIITPRGPFGVALKLGERTSFLSGP